MEYLGRRFSKLHNIILYLANTNFGLFKDDLKIARVIRQIQDKYDWPKNINVNSGSNPNRLSEVLSILKYRFQPSLSLQTLTPQVLKNVRRKNIPFKNFVAFQKKAIHSKDEYTSTELILALPGETKESFLNTISRVLNSGIQNIVIYTLMSLRGTPIASLETIKHYGHLLRYRIVPRSFSEINGEKIFESEEVVVGSKTISFQDYKNLRGLALIIVIFASSIEMFPIRKFLIEHGLNIANWIFGIHKEISKSHNFYSKYQSFLQETENELFCSRESLIDFYSNQENYDLLCEGRFGDNLIRKYKTIFLSSHYQECLRMAFTQLRQLAGKHLESKLLDCLIDDLGLYLESRDIGRL